MLKLISSRLSGRHLDAAHGACLAKPSAAQFDPSWRLNTLYACGHACALGLYLVPPSQFFAPHNEHDAR